MWDNRIVHSNSLRNISSLPREVVYIGLLPDIPRNKKYATEQLRRFQLGILPSDQWVSHGDQPRGVCAYEFSSLGKKLMAMDDEHGCS